MLSSQWFQNIFMLLLATMLTFVTTTYFNSRKRSEEKADNLAASTEVMRLKMLDLEGKLALVNAAVVPISTAFQAILIKELTHFHTPEMDALMVKIGPPNTLTEDESSRLADLLARRAKDLNGDIPPRERDAAHILPAVMKRAQLEQDILHSDNTLGAFRLVSITEILTLPVKGGVVTTATLEAKVKGAGQDE